MPSVSCCTRKLACTAVDRGRVSWSSPPDPSPGGVTLFQGEFSTHKGWLDKPLRVCSQTG